MIDFSTWKRAAELPNRPWLILGKGPTFACHRTMNLSDYNVLSLNHAVRERPCDVAHAIDVNVIKDCGEALLKNCRWLLMPRHPHVNFAPGPPLERHVQSIPVLRQLSEEGRLVWYNLSNAREHAGSPVIGVRFFSSEAALNLLGELGVTQVRSLGVDGGQGYSTEFTDLTGRTMLANGRATFNDQFAELTAIAARHGIDYSPLAEPMRVFVGTDQSQLVAARVLEYSIRKHATRPVLVDFMLNVKTPKPRHRRNRARTGFSFRRFAIPRLCDYRGRALYLDADMQVFSDLAELWDIPFDNHSVLCTSQIRRPKAWENDPSFKPGRQLSVMMLNCERLPWDVEKIVGGLDRGEFNYKQLMSDLCILPAEDIADLLPEGWNCLEWHEADQTRLVHYTVVPTQPWKNDENPLCQLWLNEYQEAVAAGVIPPAEVRQGVAAGHVKPSLMDALPLAFDAGKAGKQHRVDLSHNLKYWVVPKGRAAIRSLRRMAGATVRQLKSRIGR